MHALELADLMLFLSTLSLRRATCSHELASNSWRYFYPRSPCGERLFCWAVAHVCQFISIHALLAESDLDCAAVGY